MINIGVYHTYTSAVSYYRCIAPLMVLRKTYPNINIIIIQKGDDIAIVQNCDIVLLSRPECERSMSLIYNCKLYGIPVWIDVDDYLDGISFYHPSYYGYLTTPSRLQNFRESLGLADVITVSTYKLQELYFKYNPIIVPNAIECDFKEPEKHKDIKIAWRGTSSHALDLELSKDVFRELNKKFKLHFFGYLPTWTYNFGEVEMVGEIALITFFQIYQNSNIDFCFFPLEYTDFNLSKSNISWLETTIAGAGYYTNIFSKEFDFEGIGKDVIELLELNNSQIFDKKHEMWSKSVKSIKDNFDIFQVNEIRKDIIDKLCNQI